MISSYFIKGNLFCLWKSLSELFYMCLVQMSVCLTGRSGFALIIGLDLILDLHCIYFFSFFSILCRSQVCHLLQPRLTSFSSRPLWADSRCSPVSSALPFHSSPQGPEYFPKTNLQSCPFLVETPPTVPHCSPGEGLIPERKDFKILGPTLDF